MWTAAAEHLTLKLEMNRLILHVDSKKIRNMSLTVPKLVV